MDKDIRKHIFSDLTVIGLSVLILAGCNIAAPDETSASTESASEVTADTKIVVSAPEETPTPTPTEIPSGPSVGIVPTDLYDDLHVNVDWRDYMISHIDVPDSDTQDVSGNIYTRLSREYIDHFEPSDRYGAVFPFLFSRDYEENVASSSDRLYARYGLVDASGRIVCDGVFDIVINLQDRNYYVLESNENGVSRYGILSRDGSFYSGQIYDKIEYVSRSAGDDGPVMAGRRMTPDGLMVTFYSDDCSVLYDEMPFNVDLDGISNENDYVYDGILSPLNIFGINDDGTALIFDDLYSAYYMIDMATGDIIGSTTDNVTALAGQGIIIDYGNSYNEGPYGFRTLEGEDILTGYTGYDICGEDILFYDVEGNSSVLIDADGEIIHEFDGVARYVAGFYYLYEDGADNGASVLDSTFEQIDTTEVDIMTLDHAPDTHGSVYGSVIFYDINDNDVTAVNAITGERVTMYNQHGQCEYINDACFRLYGNDHTRVYGNDMNETVSGDDRLFICHDYGTGRDYAYGEDGALLDVVTGEQTASCAGGFSRSMAVYDGRIMIMTGADTVIYDVDGTVVFRYNALDFLND